MKKFPRRHPTLLIAAAAALVMAAAAFIIYKRVLTPGPAIEPDPTVYTCRGIDVSAHNGDIDFSKVAADGYRFALVKATEGTDFKDRKFDFNVREARRAGMLAGAYHFFRFDTDGRLQAINLLHSTRNVPLDFPLIIDVEEWGNPDAVATSEIVSRLRQMISHLEYFGQDIILYTNKDGYERFIRGNFDSYPLWICSFSEIDPEIPWSIWQYSHRGRADGISGRVDFNTLHPSVLPAAGTLEPQPIPEPDTPQPPMSADTQ